MIYVEDPGDVLPHHAERSDENWFDRRVVSKPDRKRPTESASTKSYWMTLVRHARRVTEGVVSARRDWVTGFVSNPLWPRPSLKFAFMDKG